MGNINIIQNGALPDAGSLGVLWSVAVEEQFYLAVPFILIILPTKLYPWVFCGVIVFSILFRMLYLNNDLMLEMHTFAFVGNLATGGLIAYFSISSQRFVSFFEELGLRFIVILYLSIIAIFFFRTEIFSNWLLNILSSSIIASLFAIVILEQTYSKNSIFKMRNNRVFSYLGKYTYGLYCLHLIAAIFVLQITAYLHINTQLWQVIFLESPLMLLISILMAYITYRFYEKPFLRLKDRFSFQRL
ncbi:MAG: acyltransferase [Acidobacteriota bacterium]